MRRIVRWVDSAGRSRSASSWTTRATFRKSPGSTTRCRASAARCSTLEGEPDRRRSTRRALELDGGRTLLAPLDPPEVWCAGVTYQRSRDARMEESAVQDVYDLVYDAHRPELFLKDAACAANGRAGRADRDPRRLDLERPRARDRGRPRRARDDPRVHDRQRRVVARDRGREPALPEPGEGVRAARARSARRSYIPPREPQGFQIIMRITDAEGEVLYEDETSTTLHGAHVRRACRRGSSATTPCRPAPSS